MVLRPTAQESEPDTVLDEAVASVRRDPAFRLAVIEGQDRGLELVLDGSQPSRVLVGKSPACALRLADPMVSRRHAALDLLEGQLRLLDLESTNGTFVNGVRVMDALLRGGEVIGIGGSALRVDGMGDGLAAAIGKARSFGKVVGASSAMRRLYPLCERIAASDVTVLVEGETGTGKEALAESLHEAGPRASGPFVVFDCTEVPPNLAESELFGHERGAFTGATATRKGVFEQAHGGTLFIDEIGELPLELQPKLLRAVERSEVRRVGGDKRIAVDVRLIAATRRDLDREVQEGRFRDDLFFRLAVARIELPPLRSRRGDIGVLARHFWSSLGGGDLPYDVLQHFESSPWPGNVRELRNAVARRLALGELASFSRAAEPGDEAGVGHAGPVDPLGPAGTDPIEQVLSLGLPLPRARAHLVREFERRYVARVLAQHGGNVTRAAQASGIARRYFNILRARRATE
jgi:two-component system response regulator HydG